MTIFDQASPTLLVASLVAGIAITFGALRMFPRKKKYRHVGKVENLWIYPVKSCKGIQVNEAECEQHGLRTDVLFDRHWAVSSSKGLILHQRNEPSMALIEPSLNGTVMTLTAPGMDPISFEAFPDPSEGNREKIKIFDDVYPGLDVGDEVGQWLSSYLKKDGVRLLYSAPSLGIKDGTVHTEMKMYPATPKDMSVFPDATGYMILSNKSIDYLNTKLEKPTSVKNFRPNILVDVSEAFAEDAWYKVRIGNAVLKALDHCQRCIITTVIPEIGKKDESNEPLVSLRKYRSKDGYVSPCFGMLHALEKTGTIKVGDPVYAIDQ